MKKAVSLKLILFLFFHLGGGLWNSSISQSVISQQEKHFPSIGAKPLRKSLSHPLSARATFEELVGWKRGWEKKLTEFLSFNQETLKTKKLVADSPCVLSILALGELRSETCVQFLTRWVDVEIIDKEVHSKNSRFIAVEALCQIGRGASQACLEQLREEENPLRKNLFVNVIARVESQFSGEVLFEVEINQTSNPRQLEHLSRARDLFSELKRTMKLPVQPRSKPEPYYLGNIPLSGHDSPPNLAEIFSGGAAGKKTLKELQNWRRAYIQELLQILFGGFAQDQFSTTWSCTDTAIRLLGVWRSVEAVPLLLEFVDYHLVTKEILPKETIYPCLGALIQIGEPASQACFQQLRDAEKAEKNCLLLYVLVQVESQPRARLLLEKAVQNETRSKRRKRLRNALEAMKSIEVDLPDKLPVRKVESGL